MAGAVMWLCGDSEGFVAAGDARGKQPFEAGDLSRLGGGDERCDQLLVLSHIDCPARVSREAPATAGENLSRVHLAD